jgi:hypothetical protein
LPIRLTRRTRVFGYLTRKAPIRAVRTLLFASKARALRVQIRGKARFTEVVRTFSAVVAVVFPRRIRAVQAKRRLVLRTMAFLRKPTRAAALIASTFPRKIRALLARKRLPQIRLRARFTRVFGYRTRKPRIYRIRTLIVRRRLPVHFMARFLRPVRTWIASVTHFPPGEAILVAAEERVFLVGVEIRRFLVAATTMVDVPPEQRRFTVLAELRRFEVSG